MRFSHRQDVALPDADMFALITDFDRLEAILTARGAQVTPADTPAPQPPAWNLRFNWHGKARDMRTRVVRIDRPREVELAGTVEAIGFRLLARVTPLGAAGSRLDVQVDLGAQTLKGRLILQTIKLGRGRIEQRLARHADRFIAQCVG